jgi:hypothetical protein
MEYFNYIGKLFRYKSKYGGYVENILCEDISIHETLSVESGDVKINDVEIFLISNNRNAYSIKDVEFYNNDNEKY